VYWIPQSVGNEKRFCHQPHMDRIVMKPNVIQTKASRRLLRLNEVQHQVGLGRSAIYDKIKRGEFPSPVSLGARAVAWPSDAIDAWIDERIAIANQAKGGC
jgi:prophage regulatory protein